MITWEMVARCIVYYYIYYLLYIYYYLPLHELSLSSYLFMSLQKAIRSWL